VLRILVVGPTSSPWSAIADEVAADLARLTRPGIELAYRCTGGGPTSIRDSADALAAAPFVVRTVRAAEDEGFGRQARARWHWAAPASRTSPIFS